MPDRKPAALPPATALRLAELVAYAFAAYIQVLDGETDLVVGGKAVLARAGEIVLLPAGVPHEVRARVRFKMLLTMVRPEPRTT